MLPKSIFVLGLVLLFSGCIHAPSGQQVVLPVLPEVEREQPQRQLPKSDDNAVTTRVDISVGQDEQYVPKPGTTWQWQLSGTIKTSYEVQMYDIDLVNTPQSTIDSLQARGIKVICYFSAGSYEDFRDDASAFPSAVLGKKFDDFPNEKWLDVSNYKEFASIMEKRLDLAVAKKCDGVEPDNVDGYQNNTGFAISYADQLEYNLWLADQAHKRGLSVGLKNDLEQVGDLVDSFDFAVNEQCYQYEECDLLKPFITQGKAVFGVEYELETNEFCAKANLAQYSWLKMDFDLDGGRIAC